MYQRGQTLIKNFDGTIVTIKSVGSDYVVLDGDFEPNHVVMKDKISSYYSEVPNE
jgi:hypothetical protein